LATLAGTLNITLTGEFNPNIGDTFTIMTYGSNGGTTFSTENLPALSGKAWNINYGATSVVLTVTAVAAPPGTLQFSAPTYSVNENGGSATITVTRTGGSNGAVGVRYDTGNGTASAGSDYTTASSTLSWADGDTSSKTFSVPIIDDSIYEGNETVNLTLSSPTGGAAWAVQTQ
jgi:hypothetical protein